MPLGLLFHQQCMAEMIRSESGTAKDPSRYPSTKEEDIMGFGRGALLWLIGIPLPIILLLAIFMHH
jgi:hypothetical protein